MHIVESSRFLFFFIFYLKRQECIVWRTYKFFTFFMNAFFVSSLLVLMLMWMHMLMLMLMHLPPSLLSIFLCWCWCAFHFAFHFLYLFYWCWRIFHIICFAFFLYLFNWCWCWCGCSCWRLCTFQWMFHAAISFCIFSTDANLKIMMMLAKCKWLQSPPPWLDSSLEINSKGTNPL